MPQHILSWSIPLPQIKAERTSGSVITTHTHIFIHFDSGHYEVFFTTDGTDPAPFEGQSTHRYNGPFKMLPGSRMIKAVAVARYSGEVSGMAIKSYEVIDDSFRKSDSFLEKLYRPTKVVMRGSGEVNSKGIKSYGVIGKVKEEDSYRKNDSFLHKSYIPEEVPRAMGCYDPPLLPANYEDSTDTSALYLGESDGEYDPSNYFVKNKVFVDPKLASRFGQRDQHLLVELERQYNKEKARLSASRERMAANGLPQHLMSSEKKDTYSWTDDLTSEVDSVVTSLPKPIKQQKKNKNKKALEKSSSSSSFFTSSSSSESEDEIVKNKSGKNETKKKPKHLKEQKKYKESSIKKESSMNGKDNSKGQDKNKDKKSNYEQSKDKTKEKKSSTNYKDDETNKEKNKDEKSKDGKSKEKIQEKNPPKPDKEDKKSKEKKMENKEEKCTKNKHENEYNDNKTEKKLFAKSDNEYNGDIHRNKMSVTPKPVHKTVDVRKSDTGALDSSMQFTNQSGTQINFWGNPSPEVLNNLLPKPSTNGTISQQTQQNGVIHAETQSQQQMSIKTFFKGWGSSTKKDEQTDSRSTVQSLEAGSKHQEIVSKCIKQSKLWEDPDFPCADTSLFFKDKPVDGNIEWKRPKEICSNPKMFVGGASRFDIDQGSLGNCWFLAAVATLTSQPELLNKVVPQDQSFDKNYAGVFRFHFWQYGEWVEVLIDDRLPTHQGQLIYMHSSSGNEFWSSLVEKAYAKLLGCYENMSGGSQSEALTDLTGGLCECYNFKTELPNNIFSILLKASSKHSLMGCSIDVSGDQVEEQLTNGLVVGHAYSITAVKHLVTEDGEDVELIRCRNPWGNECEWNGPWSDESKEWSEIGDQDRKELGLSKDHDGEFWMSVQDFSANFTRLEICHLPTDAKAKWACYIQHGNWKCKVNAGGCRNYPKTYQSNPQYYLKITDPDEHDEDGLCTVIVALMQKYRRKLKKDGQGNLIIGYDIFKCNANGSISVEELKRTLPVASSPTYINQREVEGRHMLEPGQYVLIPTTFQPNEEADFVARIFTETVTGALSELDQVTGQVPVSTQQQQYKAPSVQSTAHMNTQNKAQQLFKQYGGDDQQVDAYELQSILTATFSSTFRCGTFDINLCRSLVAMQDQDLTGKLNLEEFKQLWEQLTSWQGVFRSFDQDHTGHFESLELRQALSSLGYSLSNATLRAVVTRFSDQQGRVDFDDFVACLVKLKCMFDVFNSKKKTSGAEFEADEFIQMTLYS